MQRAIRIHIWAKIVFMTAAIFGLVLSSTATPAQQKKDKKGDGGVVVGKVWEMTVKKAEGKVKDNPAIEHNNGKIRVDGYDLFSGTQKNKKIGTYKVVKDNQIEVTFTDNKFKGYVVESSLALRDPPTWRGTGKKEGAEKLWFEFVFVKD